MNCQEVMELMQRHVDGDLNSEETSRMLDHVGHCPDCAGMLQRLTNLSRGLEQLPRVVPPYSLVDAILPELGNWEAAGAETAEESAVTVPRGRRAGRVRNEWIGRLTGVAAVAIVVGLLLIGGPKLLPVGSGDSNKEAASVPAGKEKAFTLFTTTTPESNNKQMEPAPSSDAGKASPDTPVSSDTRSEPVSPPSAAPSSGTVTHDDNARATASPSASPRSSPSPGRESDQAPDMPVASGPVQDKGKGIAPPSQPASPPPTMSLMQQPPEEQAESPDGQWRAMIREGQVQLVRTSDGGAAFESPTGDGTRSGLVWKADSSAVSYTFVDAEGKSMTMSLDVSELKEHTAP